MPDLAALREELRQDAPLAGRGIHGESHWLPVAHVGLELAQRTPEADPLVVLLFALFHDAGREHDGIDQDHGWRGADLARWYRSRRRYAATPAQQATLETACRDHTQGETTDDPTIGICWDADRLDLRRVGVAVNARYLSTDAARAMLVSGLPPRGDWVSLAVVYARLMGGR
jgi:uncharacterized protein